ncbi:MAG: hypothetical protein GX603_05430 [Chloroflexi bacterium]|nr:hypothetical protein [Chloroflexota bacterium]
MLDGMAIITAHKNVMLLQGQDQGFRVNMNRCSIFFACPDDLDEPRV